VRLVFGRRLDRPRKARHDAGMVDSYVERAVAAMKRHPSRRWTVAELARVAGLSRAPFARRFERAMGTSPLRYLTDLRLRLAAARLVTSDARLAEIAFEVGYATEFSFAKAFRRTYGVAPGVFRRCAWTATTALTRASLLRAA
jgi:transcriptional regulator GlxA family with amidase domain